MKHFSRPGIMAGIAAIGLILFVLLSNDDDGAAPADIGLTAADAGAQRDAPTQVAKGQGPPNTSRSTTSATAPDPNAEAVMNADEAVSRNLVPIENPELRPDLEALVSMHGEVLNDMGPNARERFWEYVDALRTDRERSAQLLHEELASLPADGVWGEHGARVAFLLGHVGHRTSVPVLIDILDRVVDERPLRPTAEIPTADEGTASTAMLVLDSLDLIATRYHAEEVVVPVIDALEATLANPDMSASIKVTAARVLLAHAAVPEDREKELAVLMGDDAFLLGTRLVGSVSEVQP